MYATKINGNWNLVNLVSRFKDVGGFHLLSDAERAKYGFYPCTVIGESYDPERENRTEVPISWELKNNHVTATYQVAPKPLSQAKEEKRESLKKERDSMIAEDINNFQMGRQQDRENIQGAIDKWEILTEGDSRHWIMADNSVKAVTKQELIDVSNAYAIRQNNVFGQYGILCTMLEMATDIEEVIAITWEDEAEEKEENS